MGNQLILSSIQCLDCKDTIISYHRHDFVSCKCGNISLDGGNSYQRVLFKENSKYSNKSIYSDAPFEIIRENYYRGGRGKDGTEPLKYTPLKQMNDEWVQACIVYNENKGKDYEFSTSMYIRELEFRKEHGIKIIEE